MSDEEKDEVKQDEPEEENQSDLSPPELTVALESDEPDLSILDKLD